ncbi:hypothetical protein ACU5B6_26725 [Moritella viscosa]|uniref:hypothetical protein n=1 Tax=Moritella viscosa TaxID=80854 RepID=UPI00091FC419|nr:hypothetical protein [Moritella viscosa]SHO15806.1 Putative membrane protein [Moritella viscosa]SHO15815.1 Putative membrane protein [Moritella viscosa]SHO19020.1 Putative membrane protein [Moritella viscosa]
MDAMINGSPAFLVIPLTLLIVVGGVMLILGSLAQLITYPILRFVLRKREDYLVDKLDTYAPKRIKGYARKTYGKSWLTGSHAAFMIVTRFIYKFVYKFTREEMESWRAGIKKELGSDYFIYWLYITMLNVTMYGGIMSVVGMLIEYQFDIAGAFR